MEEFKFKFSCGKFTFRYSFLAKRFYLDKKIHRDGDRPSTIYSDGLLFYCKNDTLHRMNGPAVTYVEGTRGRRPKDNYFFFGEKMSDEKEFNEAVAKWRSENHSEE